MTVLAENVDSQLVHPIFNEGIVAVVIVDKLSLSSQEFHCNKIPF